LDPVTHKRFLDYRERHTYFGRHDRLLGMDEYATLEAEHRVLAKEEPRDDEEEARLEELAKVLLLD
jgi:hypothetical protein